MHVKFIFNLIFVLLLLVAFAFAQENIEFEKILNCQEAGFNSCNLVLSPIYRYADATSNFGTFTYQFPPDGPYSEEWIDCGNKKDITLGKYNGESWIPIQSEIIEENGNKFIIAELNELEIFALIRTDACVSQCGFGGYLLSPFTGNVRVGKDIIFNLCGLTPGCDPNRDNVCDPQCPSGIDPDCGTCTNQAGDCCLLSRDDICDSDCAFDIDKGIRVDPDCGGGDQWCVVQDDNTCANCNLNKESCDSGCPVIEKERFTWYADPGCCTQPSISGFRSTQLTTTFNQAYASNQEDGCCVPQCDGKCDKDCIAGLDPDCSNLDKAPLIKDPNVFYNFPTKYVCTFCGDEACNEGFPNSNGFIENAITCPSDCVCESGVIDQFTLRCIPKEELDPCYLDPNSIECIAQQEGDILGIDPLPEPPEGKGFLATLAQWIANLFGFGGKEPTEAQQTAQELADVMTEEAIAAEESDTDVAPDY